MSGVEDSARIVFLVYYPRSGSTLLAGRLDRFEDVAVAVESKLVREVLLKEGELGDARDAREVYGLLEGAGRVGSLGLSGESFSRYLPHEGGYTVAEVVRAALSAHFEAVEPGAAVWVVKDGLNGYWKERIAREMPEARFLHVVRDGRAVYNSISRTAGRRGLGAASARDPVSISRSWASFVGGMRRFETAHPDRSLTCRYEDLLADETGELARLREFFGLPALRAPTGEGDFYRRMPERERAVHPLVPGPLVPERATAWKEELDRGRLLVFELRAKKTLTRLGYAPVEDRWAFRSLLDHRLAAACVASLASQIRRWARLLLDPEGLRRFLDAGRLSRGDAALHRAGAARAPRR